MCTLFFCSRRQCVSNRRAKDQGEFIALDSRADRQAVPVAGRIFRFQREHFADRGHGGLHSSPEGTPSEAWLLRGIGENPGAPRDVVNSAVPGGTRNCSNALFPALTCRAGFCRPCGAGICEAPLGRPGLLPTIVHLHFHLTHTGLPSIILVSTQTRSPAQSWNSAGPVGVLALLMSPNAASRSEDFGRVS